MSILPPRPLSLQAAFVRRMMIASAVCVILGLAIAVGLVAWQAGEVGKLLDEQTIWAHGVPSAGSQVEGHATTRNFFFHDYDLDVSFADAAGAVRREHLSFMTVWSTIDQTVPSAVHFDPANPSRFAVSWALDVSGGRWAAFAVFLSFGLGFGGLLVFVAWKALERLRAAREVAKASDEVECVLLGVNEQMVNGRPSGNLEYRFVVPPLAQRAPGEQGYRDEGLQTAPVERVAMISRKEGEPFYTSRGPAETKVLVLVSREHPSRFVLVRNDLYPFSVSGDAREAAVARHVGAVTAG